MVRLSHVNVGRSLKLQNTTKRLILLFFFAACVTGNVLLSPFAVRLDLSKGKAYTLSESTKKILKKIDNSVAIDFFVSSDLPTRLIPLKNEVTDLLKEYKKSGGSKVQLTILDPKKDDNALKKAKEEGIPEIQFSQMEQDKYAVSASYFGIGLNDNIDHATIPQVTEVNSLEYNVTAAIYKLTRKDTPKIGFIGLSEPANPAQDTIGSLRRILAQQFQLETLDISKISSDVKSLVVFDTNKKQYNDSEKKKLQEYLSGGGKVLFFIDGAWVQDNLTTIPAAHDLFSLMQDWGISVNNNLILSSSSELVNFGNDVVSYMVPYPLWVKTNQFNVRSAYFSNVNQLTFPWVSSLSLQKKSDTDVHYLVNSTNKSWEQSGKFILNPQIIPKPQPKDLKEFIIGAEAKKKNGGQIVVIPSSRFIGERYLSRTSDNLEFILNVLNDLASGGELSGIRQRSVAFYPLPSLSSQEQDIFKYANILLLPAAFAVYGLLRLSKRK